MTQRQVLVFFFCVGLTACSPENPTHLSQNTDLELKGSSDPSSGNVQLLITTPSYLNHQFQTLYAHGSPPQAFMTGLPMDILLVPELLKAIDGSKLLVILDRAMNSSLIWVDGNKQQIIRQQSVGQEGASAQWAVTLHDHLLAISFFNQNEIWVVDRNSGELLNRIDVSRFAGLDGIAEVGPLEVMGDFLIASVLGIHQSSFSVQDPNESALLVFNRDTYELTDIVRLQSGNVFERMQVMDNELWVLEAGNFNAKDGRISKHTVNLQTGKVTSSTEVLTESALGQEIVDFWFNSQDQTLYLITSTNALLSNNTQFVSCSLALPNACDSKKVFLDDQDGGNFRSLCVSSNTQAKAKILVLSRASEKTGIFEFVADQPATSLFIPYDISSPPERCFQVK